MSSFGLSNDELAFLASHVKPTDVFFEYGSGLTTTYIAARCKRVISVEHQPAWAAMMTLTCHNLGHRNVTLVSCPPDLPYVEGTEDDGSAEVFASYVSAYRQADVVLVDGRARVACVDYVNGQTTPWRLGHGAPQLFLHDVDRKIYAPVYRLLKEITRVDRLALMEWK